MRRALAWVEGRRWATITAVLAQLVCVALLVAACDMGGNVSPAATPTNTVAAAGTSTPSAGGSIPIATASSPEPLPSATISSGIADTTTTPDKEASDLNGVLTVVPDAVSPTPVPLANVSSADQVSIYSMVVAGLLKGEKAKNIYISPYVGQGERLDAPNEGMPVPNTLDDTLQSGDKNHSFQLVEFADAVGALEDGGKVKNNGVFLTLGQITVDTVDKGTVQVRGSLYRGVANGMGNAYHFQHDSSGWTLLNVTSEWNDQQGSVATTKAILDEGVVKQRRRPEVRQPVQRPST